MEEASVAGESPDRSKQRESSEDPTSGGASPVPEARAGATDGEARDPRVSVTRESAGAPGGAAEPRGGVDTATRVLTVPETEAEAEADGGSDAGSGSDADAGSGSGRDSDGGDDAGTDAAAEDGSTDEAGADGGADDTDGASKDEPEGADADGAKNEDEDEDEGEGEGETGGAGQGADGSAPAEGRLREAVAAWVVTADEREAANARREDASDAADGDGDGDSAGDAGKAGQGAAADEPSATSTSTGSSPTSAKPSKASKDAEPAEEPDAPVEAPEKPAESGKSAKPDDTAEPDDPADGSDRPSAPAEPVVDQPTAIFRNPASTKPPVDQPTTMLKFGGTADKAKAKPGQGAEKGENPENPEDGKPGKPGAAHAPPTTRPRPEAPAERTSKFVALRHPDDPATRKPPVPPAPPAPPVGAPQPPAAGPVTAVPPAVPERTTVQPLPPKPPLDLLAELTNTPPPPETPLRTAVRRVKIWTPLVVLLVIVFAVVQSMRPLPAPGLDLTARDSFTFEGGKVAIPWPVSGQAALDVQGIGTFGSSGAQKPVPIASVAKVMTAYIILREHPLKSGEDGPMIDIDQAAQDQSRAGQESTVDVTKGDSISQREALESILIASANNVARLLARWDAGSEQAFVDKMNEAAKDLGMTNTTYTDPSGLNDTTVSTAVDQVKLGKAAMEAPVFREVAAMMSYDDYKGVNHSNWNQLVGSNDVVGIKTGTTTSALGNLLFAAKKEVGGETRTIVGAVVRQPSGGPENTILSAALDSSDKLIRAAQAALESSTILKKGTVVGYVDDRLGGRTPVVATRDVTAVGWPGLTVKLTFRADEVPHAAPAGTKVGTLTVGDGDSAGAVEVPVALQEDLVEPGFGAKLTRLG
ncbi:D-alanyl-D-alanine carboxypeptidase [Streptomyces tagetis]|uniref:serine-type D-Ala-D-Ala carboxypeptidase n=1 Tax=Streptomyces tagetis TaxID=2820809 RepID=A0A940XTJ9_9ACTN|nr:D-alanyl-D-alanine carboxypeptidase [Streptomyces sp. RG38]MBQ0829373.1 D-alanyl-D-alanine carboxypeptidase [Streptomyces sp. RG38]